MKRQQKLSLFFTQKRMAVEENQEDGLDMDGEAGEVSSMLSQPPELQEPMASNSPSNTVRKFRPAWKNVYPWLQYDDDVMSCSFCVKHKKKTMRLRRERLTLDLLRSSDTWLTMNMLKR